MELLFLFISLKAQEWCFLSWEQELCAASLTFCLDSQRGLDWQSSLASEPFLSEHWFSSYLCSSPESIPLGSFPNTRVNCFHLNWTRGMHTDQNGKTWPQRHACRTPRGQVLQGHRRTLTYTFELVVMGSDCNRVDWFDCGKQKKKKSHGWFTVIHSGLNVGHMQINIISKSGLNTLSESIYPATPEYLWSAVIKISLPQRAHLEECNSEREACNAAPLRCYVVWFVG